MLQRPWPVRVVVRRCAHEVSRPASPPWTQVASHSVCCRRRPMGDPVGLRFAVARLRGCMGSTASVGEQLLRLDPREQQSAVPHCVRLQPVDALLRPGSLPSILRKSVECSGLPFR